MLTGILLLYCPDQPGIIASLSQFFAERDLNIIDANQHSTDPEDGRFFLRLAFHFPKTTLLSDLKIIPELKKD